MSIATLKTSCVEKNNINRPFATNDHMVQNPPCWRASSFLHWDVKTKRPQPVKLDWPLV